MQTAISLEDDTITTMCGTCGSDLSYNDDTDTMATFISFKRESLLLFPLVTRLII